MCIYRYLVEFKYTQKKLKSLFMDKVSTMTLTRQSSKQVFSASSNKEMCYGLLRDECAMFYFSISKSHKIKNKSKMCARCNSRWFCKRFFE